MSSGVDSQTLTRAQIAERKHVLRRHKSSPARQRLQKPASSTRPRTLRASPRRLQPPQAPIGHGTESDRRISTFLRDVTGSADAPVPEDAEAVASWRRAREYMRTLVEPDDPLTTMSRQMKLCNRLLATQLAEAKARIQPPIPHDAQPGAVVVIPRLPLPSVAASPRPDGTHTAPCTPEVSGTDTEPTTAQSSWEGDLDELEVGEPADTAEASEMDAEGEDDGVLQNRREDASRHHVTVASATAVQPRTPRKVAFRLPYDTGSSPPSAREDDDDAEEVGLPALRAVTPRSGRPAMHSRVLCLVGDLNYSLLHHLGVVLYYVETGLLHCVTHICAEQFAMPLALLLRLHWDTLCSHRGDASEFVRELLWPITVFMHNHPRTWGEVWRVYCRMMHVSPSTRWMGRDACEEAGVPRCHLFVHRDPDQGNYAEGQVAYFHDDNLQHWAYGEVLVQTWKYWYSRGRTKRPSARQPMVRATTYTHLAELLPTFAQDADLHAFAEEERQFQVWMSYAGRSSPPPLHATNFGPNDTSRLLNVYEFASTFWTLAMSPRALSRVSEFTVYSLHHGSSFHTLHLHDLRDRGISVAKASSSAKIKAMVTQQYRRHRSLPATEAWQLDAGVNWGYLVCRLTEAGVGQSQRYWHFYCSQRETNIVVHQPGDPEVFEIKGRSAPSSVTDSVFDPEKLSSASLSTQLEHAERTSTLPNKTRCTLCSWFRKSKKRTSVYISVHASSGAADAHKVKKTLKLGSQPAFHKRGVCVLRNVRAKQAMKLSVVVGAPHVEIRLERQRPRLLHPVELIGRRHTHQRHDYLTHKILQVARLDVLVRAQQGIQRRSCCGVESLLLEPVLTSGAHIVVDAVAEISGQAIEHQRL